MAKIGIVTFHKAHNFGAVLQCYALQTALSKTGNNVEIIDYKCDSIEGAYPNGFPRFKGKPIKGFIKELLISIIKGPRQYIRFHKFDHFIHKYFKLSLQIKNKDVDLIDKYDVIIFGSDQIWNTYTTNNDTFYFGDFRFDGKRVSYAASAGNAENILYEKITLLSRFSALGVREHSIREILTGYDLSGINVNVDPTLLLTGAEWINSFSLKRKPYLNKEYVLVYPLRERISTLDMAQMLAGENCLNLKEIGAEVILKKYPNRYEKVGPIEFLNFVYNAKVVVTNSFHGTLFSIIFRKDFYTVALNDGRDGRVFNLLKSLNLESRIIEVGKRIEYKPIDYTLIESKIQKSVERSYEYLKSSILV